MQFICSYGLTHIQVKRFDVLGWTKNKIALLEFFMFQLKIDKSLTGSLIELDVGGMSVAIIDTAFVLAFASTR